MKTTKQIRLFVAFVAISLGAVSFTSCSSDNDDVEPVKEGIVRSELVFTEVTGESVEAHGDHFHGLDAGVEGESITVSFDENGNATKNGHLHLEADAAYKIELKAWNHEGREVQGDFIADKPTADQYKAFLIGGNFILNPNSSTESGAIFQPREKVYGNGEAVNGKYEVTGILSYFTVGHDNEGATKNVTYILRKVTPETKAKIERTDWNRNDYTTAFPGENILELKFEIHAEHGHSH